MPSDAKKKRDQKKKEAAKNRSNPKPKCAADASTSAEGEVAENLEQQQEPQVQNGDILNGKAIKELSIKDDRVNGDDDDTAVPEAQLDAVEVENAKARSCAGVIASHPRSRDLKIDNLTLTFYGSELLSDTQLEFNHGRRYGLLGFNGCGKSTLLQALANREFDIPEHFDIFLLSREMPASDKSALECVIEVDQERQQLELEAEELAHFDDDASQEKLMDIYNRLDEMSSEMAEVKAAELLHGLGFTHEMMQKKCRDFSGGWRMRIALARALFLKPSLLLLDEPTNHLDLDACVWLEEELKTYSRILVVVSHSQDFLNGVCTNIVHFDRYKLKYYGGNYDTFAKTRLELSENAMKRYQWEQDQIAHMKNYIARFGHGSAKLARQAQSKEKVLGKMLAAGLTEKMVQDKVKEFYFLDPGVVPPPVIMVQHVAFRYSPDKPLIYKDLDFGVDLDTRVALVGPNGAGKSTLLKLISAELMPSDGLIRRHSHVKIGRYHQHLHETLDLDLSALEFMMKSYPDVKEIEEMRKIIGRYGITGRQQVCPMKQLSDGQRCRVSFAWLARQCPHLLLLDEPTNHLDMESIDALADAINAFEGGMILVSHDFRLVSQVTEEIWVCENQKITKWPGDIFSYKEHLRKRIDKDRKNRKKLTSLATGH